MSNVVTFDTETTTWNTGNPFDPRNFLVCYSIAYEDGPASAVKWNDQTKILLQYQLDKASTIVVFNGKFDLQWIVREGLTYDPKKIWDVQLAHFLLSNQTHRFPSLNEVALSFDLPTKLDVVKTEYWDKGINTYDIPWEVLEEYASHDALLTRECYHKQKQLLTGAQLTLFRLQCQDLSILREMEANGLPYDEDLCDVRAEQLDDEIKTIKTELASIYPNIPINFGSNDHLSAFLYGGTIKEDSKEFVGFFKTGVKQGQPKYKNVVIEHELPRLYTPLKGSAMKKEGNFAVDESTLRKLRGKKALVEKILQLSKLEKLNGTYYRGLTALRKTMGWPKGLLHGTFNQVVAATGRLSSSKPNLQNFASDLQDIFVSKYDD